MTDTFLTFKKFNDVEIANEIVELLKAKQIDFHIDEDYKQFSNPLLSDNAVDHRVCLKLRAEDFVKAQSVIDEYYRDIADSIGKDYFLYKYTDNDLFDILTKPDEWGELNCQLAQKILVERGHDINPETIKQHIEQITTEDAKPEVAGKIYIFLGYVVAILGGLLAIMYGEHLVSSKKTMRDGTQVYTYREEDRKHGKRIFRIGIVFLIIGLILFIYIKLRQL
ncbi:MAG: hypothetical protein RL660_2308 [Bacteroidota bacterium]|jgi:hypothetical protein